MTGYDFKTLIYKEIGFFCRMGRESIPLIDDYAHL